MSYVGELANRQVLPIITDNGLGSLRINVRDVPRTPTIKVQIYDGALYLRMVERRFAFLITVLIAGGKIVGSTAARFSELDLKRSSRLGPGALGTDQMHC